MSKTFSIDLSFENYWYLIILIQIHQSSVISLVVNGVVSSIIIKMIKPTGGCHYNYNSTDNSDRALIST